MDLSAWAFTSQHCPVRAERRDRMLICNEQRGPSPSGDPALIPFRAQHIQRRDAPADSSTSTAKAPDEDPIWVTKCQLRAPA
jgi:hypothetical protein